MRVEHELRPPRCPGLPGAYDVHRARVAAFEGRYKVIAEPFDRYDLNKLLARIAAHDANTPAPLTA